MSNANGVMMYSMMKEHLEKAAILKRRISDLPEAKKRNVWKKETPWREQVLAADLDLTMTLYSWQTLVSSPSLLQTFKDFSLTGTEVETLISYPYLDQLSTEEWLLITKEKQPFFDRLSSIVFHVSAYREWMVPLVLDQLLHSRSEEQLIKQSLRYQQHFNHRHASENCRDHETVMAAVKMTYDMEMDLSQVQDVVGNCRCQTEEGKQYFRQLGTWLVRHKPLLQEGDDLLDFLAGYHLLRETLSVEQLEQVALNRQDTLVQDLTQIGKSVLTDIPEKVSKRFIHKQEDALTVLFAPYEEWMKTESQRYREHAHHSYSYDHSQNCKKRLVFLQKAVFDGKKAFLRLYQPVAEKDLFPEIHMGVLADPLFYELVNVNTLNEQTLKKAMSLKVQTRSISNVSGPLTFQEFVFLNQAHGIQRTLFDLLAHIKVDEKLLMLKAVPAFYWNKSYLVSEQTFITALLAAMQEKGFREYVQLTKTHGVSKKYALLMHVLKPLFAPVWQEIESDVDVELLMKYPIRGGESILAMKTRLYRNLPIMQKFREFLGASSDFLQDNQKRLYAFYETGMMNVVLTYKDALKSSQEHNLCLLVKAEIAGKLTAIKYRDEDFVKEIGMLMPIAQKEQWKANLQKEKGALVIEETSDFHHLIQMGEIPTSTCMSWKDGSYRSCLLSIFDANKKMVVVKKDDKVVARAVLRLTKVNEAAEGMSQDLTFVDIETLQEDQQSERTDLYQGERLMLFLERLYTPVTGDEQADIEKEVILLVMKKAKEMGVELFLATTYGEGHVNVNKVTVPVFISRSKNGNQYLDSMGGESNENSGGKYHRAAVYQVK